MIKKGERFYIATGSYSDFGYIAAVEALRDFEPVEFIQPYADSFNVRVGEWPHAYVTESAVVLAAESAGLVRELGRYDSVGQEYLWVECGRYGEMDVACNRRLQSCIRKNDYEYVEDVRIPLPGLAEEAKRLRQEADEKRELERTLLKEIEEQDYLAYRPADRLSSEVIVMVKPLTEDPLESLRNDPNVKKKVLIDG